MAREVAVGDRGEGRLWRRYSPEVTLSGLLVSMAALILAFNSGPVDWPLVALILIVTFGLFCAVFAGSLCVRDLVEGRAARKAAREEEEQRKAAEDRKEESLVKAFRNSGMTALDLRRLYQAVR